MVLLAFSIPLYFNLQSILIGLLVISWVATGQYKGAWKRFKENSYSIYWVLYFLVFGFSILYSSDMQEGFNDLLRKASFLILPIIVATSKELDEPTYLQIHQGFVMGCIVAFLLCTGNGLLQYSTVGIDALFSDSLAGFTHNNAVNLSAKCFYALLFMLNYKKPFQKVKEGQTFIIILLFLFIILLASKTIVLISIVFLFIYSFRHAKENFARRKKIRVALISALVIFVLSFFIKDSPVLKRFHDLTNVYEVTQTDEQFDIGPADNFSKRLAMWKAAKENLEEDQQWIMGVGSGDIKQVQADRLSSPDFSYANYYNFASLSSLNIHNMYLQTFLATGIVGLVILLMLSVFLLYYAIRYRLVFFAQFLFLFILFMMQESMFQTQSGIVFFCFFHLLFIKRHGITLLPHKTSGFFK